MDSLLTFLNSSFGVVLTTAVLGAVGLFTWQRQDWLFKERYLRTQVMLDRQLDLVERVNRDVGKLVALAASISAPILKGPVPEDQTNESIRSYNEFQSSWFGLCEAYKALLAFYFPIEVVDSFARVVEATENLDMSLTDVRTTAGADKAYNTGLAVYGDLRAWNAEIVGQIKGGPRMTGRSRRRPRAGRAGSSSKAVTSRRPASNNDS
jgi:hypothetical protein